MAKDYDRSFDEEIRTEPEQTVQEQPLPLDDRDSELKCFYDLMEYLLDEMTNKATPVPFSKKSIVDAAAIMDMCENLRKVVPNALVQAARLLDEQDRIMASTDQYTKNRLAQSKIKAQAIEDEAKERAETIRHDAELHAEDIVKDAEIRACALLDQNTIVKKAEEKARQIIDNANQEAQEMVNGAMDYCDKLLESGEKAMQDSYGLLRKSRQMLRERQSSEE